MVPDDRVPDAKRGLRFAPEILPCLSLSFDRQTSATASRNLTGCKALRIHEKFREPLNHSGLRIGNVLGLKGVSLSVVELWSL